MRQYPSVMQSLVQRLPWAAFDRLVDEHGADTYVRRLTTRTQLTAMLYAQLAGAASLREIVAASASHRGRFYHLGGRPVARSTLADANALRPAAMFAGLLGTLMGQAQGGLKRKMEDVVRLVDATSLKLAGLGTAWARFSAGVGGAKAHVVLDPDAAQPVYLAITPARINDITAAKAMPIEPGATYVFDLGYYDYGWWARLDAQGCRLVTRLKSNTPLRLKAELPVTDGSPILSDRIGLLPARQAASRRNPFQDPVREVRVRTESGKLLRIVSNDLDAPAEEIAALYKRRWDIELFFRWVKQTLKIKHFLGRSENAVRIQLAVALIAFLLLRLAHRQVKMSGSLLAFHRLIKSNLMHRRALDRLLEPEAAPQRDIGQFVLDFP
jgi:Transposase DDE domain/Domain of unknown function (DUF4372)